MATSIQSAPGQSCALALAVQQDFQTLSELFSSDAAVQAELPEIASVRATAERGLHLTNQLLAALDAEVTR